MIPKMKKFLFAGANDEIDQFFSRAQEIGYMEFISIHSKKNTPTSDMIKQMIESLKILKRLPMVKQEFASYFDAKTKVKNILFLSREIEHFHEQVRVLKGELVRIQPLGNFTIEEIENLKQSANKFVQFFVARNSKIKDQELPNSVIHINSQFDEDYFLYIGDHPLVNPLFSELVVTSSVSDLKAEIDRINKKVEELEKELKGLVAYQSIIQESLLEEINKENLLQAKHLVDFQIEGFIFFVEAWIPENKVELLLPLIDGLAIICDEVGIESTDVVPTYMENKGFAALGEDLVNIYDTPATTDKDPSSWVMWAFALFFSMIVADAGYGLIYLIIAIFLWIKFPDWQGSKYRFKKLLTVLSSFCIIWGMLIGSYFSVQIKPENPINKVSLLYYLATKKVEFHMAAQDQIYQAWVKEFPAVSSAKNPVDFFNYGIDSKKEAVKYKLLGEIYDTLLLEIALIVGVVHLCFSLLRNIRKSYSGFGWIMFIIGGYLYFPSLLEADSIVHYLNWIDANIARVVGLQLFCTGLGIAVVTALIQDKLAGVGEILKSIQIFADILSYLRLYALGVASMIMASTFNELGEMIGLAFGVFIVIIGHGINIVIGIMGGIIHGLRLNFLEWYHYCFEGGGKAFNPLKIIKL
jgi:V/A-type H+-transporting ATPase subunit I